MDDLGHVQNAEDAEVTAFVAELLMQWMIKASILLTVAVGTVGTAENSAFAQQDSRCEADLARVEKGFCLSEAHQTGSLKYSWSVNDSTFNLTAKSCDGTAGSSRDLVIAIDRSQNAWYADTSRGKSGADNISIATYVITKLRDEAQAHPDHKPNISVVLFSSAPDCREWTGGPIAVNREFPCLYVKAGSVADPAHVDNLLGILKAAEAKYSQGGLAATSDYGIVAELLAKDGVELAAKNNTQAGLMLFSDGRTYRGEADDAFAYLRSTNYQRAQDEAFNKFSTAAMKKYRLVFALTPAKDIAFDGTHADAYDNMCALPEASAADCTGNGIDYNQPKTWPVNQLDMQAFAARLGTALPGATKSVVLLNAKQDIDAGIDALRFGGQSTIEAVTYSVNGATAQQGAIAGAGFSLKGLPSGKDLAIDLRLKVNGSELNIPMTVATKEVPYEGTQLTDREMLCQTGDAMPRIKLKDLQGGSASCGVVVGEHKSEFPGFLFFMAIPVLLSLLLTGNRRAAGVAVVTGVVLLGAANAKAQDGGLNVLQYRPVLDGVGSTERATTQPAGTVNAGIFMDYANDAVELGGEQHKRIDSVMDNLVTAHAVSSVGLHRRITLGVHIPFVQHSNVDRAVDGEETSRSQIGQPADSTVTFKVNLLERTNYALAVMPLATIATGNPELLIGDGTNNYGSLLLVSGILGGLSWAFNTGYLHRQKALELEDDRASTVQVRGQFVNYGGAEYRVSQLWSMGGSVQAKMTTGSNFGLNNSNPAEWSVIAKLRPSSGLEAVAGVGTGLGRGYGSPDYRVQAGFTYIMGSGDGRDRAVASRTVAARKPRSN